MEHFRHVLAEPNVERWTWFRLQGERATWPKIAMIRTHTRISETLTDNIQLLHKQRAMSDRFIAHMLSRNIRIEEYLIDQLFNSSEKRLARTLLLLARYGKQD